MSPTSRTSSVRELAVIRFALLAGVLLFGGVSWYVNQKRGTQPLNADPRAFASFRIIVPLLCASALAVAVIMRGRLARERDPGRRASLRMTGWSVGEASALSGCVYYFLSGDPRLYVLGVVALLATFIIVPLRES